MTDQSEKPTGLALMRADFPENQVSKLPKESKRQIEERKANAANGINCKTCGSFHHKNAVHLDYVGHAAITNRLLDVDPHWTWEPLSVGPDGLPAFDKFGGLWIKLTVCGHTRMGYGDAGMKSGGDAIKEAIGDAIRNASMRFGAALELWHKGDLHGDDDLPPGAGDDGKQDPPPPPPPKFYSDEMFEANFPTWEQLIASGKKTAAKIIAQVESKAPLTDAQKKKINSVKPQAAAGAQA